MPKCEHCGYAVSGFECETCESCWECVGKVYDCEECHPPSKYNFPKSSKKCAEGYVTAVERTFVKSAFPSSNMMLK